MNYRLVNRIIVNSNNAVVTFHLNLQPYLLSIGNIIQTSLFWEQEEADQGPHKVSFKVDKDDQPEICEKLSSNLAQRGVYINTHNVYILINYPQKIMFPL